MTNVVREVWQGILSPSATESISVCTVEEIDETIGVLIADQVDPELFIANLKLLLMDGMKTGREFWGIEAGLRKPTPSAANHVPLHKRASAFPLWFYAAFPDVMTWFHQWQRQYVKSHGFPLDYEHMAAAVVERFGIHAEAAKDEVINDKGQYRAKYLANLVKYYKSVSGEYLEVSIRAGSPSDIYMGHEILERLGTKNNATLIAENTMKFYLELSRNYRNQFASEANLLAAAGILDAQWYVFADKTIDPLCICSLAEESVSSSASVEDAIADFIVELVAKILNATPPSVPMPTARSWCREQRANIVDAVGKVRAQYTREERFSRDTTAFMTHAEFEQCREIVTRSDPLTSKESASRFSLAQPLWHLVLLNMMTMGLYQFYWFYRNWRDLRDHNDAIRVNPLLRTVALLIPIVNLVLVYGQLKDIEVIAKTANVEGVYSPNWVMFGWTAMGFIATMIDPLAFWSGALAAIPLTYAQDTLNRYWQTQLPDRAIRSTFSVGEVGVVAMGAVVLVLIYL